MASGGIASLTAKAMKLIEKINEERDDQKSSRSKQTTTKQPGNPIRSPRWRVIVTIEPEQKRIPRHHASRARAVAAGLTDEDIARLVKDTQRHAELQRG